MKGQRSIWTLAGGVLLLILVPALASASPALQQEGQNLIRNAGFEGGWHWQGGDTFLGKIADNWTAWWVDDATGKDPHASDFWKNQRPEYGLAGMEYYVPDQVHGGSRSLQYGKRYATHTAGVFQRISGITPGVKLRFTAWGFVYGKDQDSSKTPGYVHMRIGIDPTGGTNVFGGSVVWSPEAHPVAVNTGSNWHQFTVEAEAQSETVTVFLYSSPEWPMNEALTTQWDDTNMVVTTPAEPPTNTPPPPLPTRTAGPPPATATPRPDGSVVHTVQSGETLWSIAIRYTPTGMTADQMLERIKNLNNDPTLIYPGQELVIAVPQNPLPVASSAAEAATQPESPATEAQSPATEAQSPTAEAQAPAAEAQSPAAQAQPSTASSAICVLAYHDRNVNGAYDADTEEKLPNAGFTLSNQNGNVVGSYVSDGVNEPHCFEQLIQDTYLVQLTKPAGYNAVTSEYWAITLQQGQTANIILGHVRDPDAPETEADPLVVADAGSKSNPLNVFSSPSEENTENEESEPKKSLLAQAGEVAIGVSGIFVLLLAGAVGVAFVASKRRM
jgi:LysM repeat protein